MTRPPVICLMGPTASGKTGIALELAARLPVELVSVDSALVYRGMDVGTAKPDKATLARVPHRLVDIREPEEPYSAGLFLQDARAAIDEIHATGRIPLLVGGTMLYFRALTAGMADLPPASAAIREALDTEARESSWPALHAELQAVDPAAAARINPNDSQRIQRALEVYRVSGRPLSAWQAQTEAPGAFRFLKIALLPARRARLHQRIAVRLDKMLVAGFVDEVRDLRARPGLDADSPAMRAVGYRQIWAHLAGETDLDTARQRTLAATRQLAKRQITWLRSEPSLRVHDPLEDGVFGAILDDIEALLAA